MTEATGGGGGFAHGLALVRRHGLWILAGVAALPSVNVVGLLAGAEAARHATRHAPGDFVIAILAVTGAVEVLRFRRPWRRAVAPAAAFAWVAVAAAATLIASFGRDGIAWGRAAREVVQLVEVLVVGYGWVRWAPRNSPAEAGRDLDRALYALGGAVTANVLLALVQLTRVEHAFHVRGLFEHRNALGTFLAVTLPPLVATGFAPGRHWGVRVWFLATAVLGVLVTTSAGLLAAAALGITAAAVAAGARAADGSRLPRFAYGLLAAAGIATVVLFVQPVLVPSVRRAQLRSVAAFPEDEEGRAAPSMRIRRWAAALDCVGDHAALGLGPGQFQDGIRPYYRPPFDKPLGRSDDVPGYDVRFDEPGSQSLYAVTAVEMGLLGLVAVGYFLASALGRLTASSARDPSGFAAGALGSAVAVIVACLFSSVMVRGVALVFVLVLALGERAGGSANVVPERR